MRNLFIDAATKAIANHPRLVSISQIEGEESSWVLITAVFDTNLPSTWRAAGENPHGVKTQEEVQILFLSTFPKTKPYITLRPDFNTNLPHINHHKAGDRISPCVVHGDILETLHTDGFARLPIQIADWLERAGEGNLIDAELGWEAMRRNDISDAIYLDVDQISGTVPKLGDLQLFDIYSCSNETDDVSLAFKPTLRPAKRFLGWELQAILDKTKQNEKFDIVSSLLAICWPQIGFDGSVRINDQYKPDTVQTLADLRNAASEYGCIQALDLFIKYFNDAATDLRSTTKIPIYVSLAVRRPFHLIGMTGNFEHLVYRFDGSIPNGISDPSTIGVRPTSILSPISKPLLRRTSGLHESNKGLYCTFLGCGSLGSKMAMHVARAGYMPRALVDKDTFAMHNSARHVLHPNGAFRTPTKVEQLAEILAMYPDGDQLIQFKQDVQRIPKNKKWQTAFYDAESLLINSTGAARVRNYLAGADFQTRIMEVCAMNMGNVGVLNIEGTGRNPSTTDLMAFAYEKLRSSDSLTTSQNLDRNILRVGVGCNSVTLPISDARISLIAASTAQAILNLHENGLPAMGKLSLAKINTDGMSISWNHFELGATRIANLDDPSGWTVRILDTAHSKIQEDVDRHISVETGGMIVGRASPINREIVIVDVLPAPPDSTRSATAFTLGIEGRSEAISQYEKPGKRVLWWLGTWHSHLGPFGPSSTDINTADALIGKIRGAAVLLIHKPDGYSALVRDGI